MLRNMAEHMPESMPGHMFNRMSKSMPTWLTMYVRTCARQNDEEWQRLNQKICQVECQIMSNQLSKDMPDCDIVLWCCRAISEHGATGRKLVDCSQQQIRLGLPTPSTRVSNMVQQATPALQRQRNTPSVSSVWYVRKYVTVKGFELPGLFMVSITRSKVLFSHHYSHIAFASGALGDGWPWGTARQDPSNCSRPAAFIGQRKVE